MLSRKLMVPAIAAVVAGSGFAAMASNNVVNSYSGVGQGNVVGYDITGTRFVAADNAPQNIGYVWFTATPKDAAGHIPGNATIRFTGASANTGWLPCTATETYSAGGGRLFTCDVRGAGGQGVDNAQSAMQVSVIG